MKILIDASRAVIESAGIARYTQKICEHLIKNDRRNQYTFLVTFARWDQTKRQKIRCLQKLAPVVIRRLPGQLKEYFWEKKWAGTLFDRWYQDFDLFFAPSFLELPRFIKIPSAVVIYDLTTVRFPEQRGKKISHKLTKKVLLACQTAQKIIAISRQTKTDLIQYGRILTDKIAVTHLAAGADFRVIPKYEKRRFILSVGTLEPRKNLPTVFKAYSRLPENITRQYDLVVVGGQGWNDSAIFLTLEKNRLSGKIKLLGFVSDKKLIKLYNQAALFVYPSLFEGFGLPVLEAMQCGAPVITARLSSLPEVGGQAVIYVKNSLDYRELGRKIVKLLSNLNLRKTYRERGLNQAKKFSWDQTACQTIQIFNRLMR